MRRSIILAVGLLVVSLLPATSTALDSLGCEWTASQADQRVGGLHFFVEHADGVPSATLVYQEANDLPGVQRADRFKTDADCQHGPDHRIAWAGCVPNEDGYACGLGFTLPHLPSGPLIPNASS